MNSSRRYWTFQFAGWGGYSAAGAAISALYVGWSASLLLGYALFFLYSIGLTELFRWVIEREGWLTLGGLRAGVRLVAGVLLIAGIQFALVWSVSRGLFRTTWPEEALVGLAWGTTFVTGTWTVLYIRLTEKRRLLERETELRLALREAELRALQRQIDPHFLFNCLNSIRGLVMEDPARAQEMVTRLAQLLRHNLRREPRDTISLASEIAVVSDYLALEGVRFDERLKVDIDIPREAYDIEVPAMLLSTLVENAVVHGIAPSPAGGNVAIQASRLGSFLRIEVGNPGRLGGSPGEGLGLANLRERLRLLYGDAATLTIENTERDRVLTTVTVPVER